MTERESERRRRFDDLFSAYSADIVAYCGWRAGPSGDAQDAVADVFMTAWRRLDELPEGDAARVWLYATARRVLANQRRSNRRRAALHERLARETLVPPQPPVPGREESLVRDALGSLGPRDREVLLLAEWEGLTPAEIAVVLDVRTVTARGRLHRARRRSAGTAGTWTSPGKRPTGREGPDRSSASSTGRSTASTSTAAGSCWAARTASTPGAGRRRTSTSPPCVRTWAA